MLIFLRKSLFSNVSKLIKLDIFDCRMAKIYCDINQCNASVQYFAILLADKCYTLSRKPLTLNNTPTLTLMRRNKRRSTMRQCFRQKICRATKSLCSRRPKILAVR